MCFNYSVLRSIFSFINACSEKETIVEGSPSSSQNKTQFPRPWLVGCASSTVFPNAPTVVRQADGEHLVFFLFTFITYWNKASTSIGSKNAKWFHINISKTIYCRKDMDLRVHGVGISQFPCSKIQYWQGAGSNLHRKIAGLQTQSVLGSTDLTSAKGLAAFLGNPFFNEAVQSHGQQGHLRVTLP